MDTMSNMNIIPSFDIMDGQLVHLRQGDFEQKTVYPKTPLEMARDLETAGITHLHMIDLDGARAGNPVNLHILEQIAARTRLSINYGGGLRSIPALRQVWDAGADMFSVGSMPVIAPDEFRAWVERFGPERFLVGADVRNRKIAVHGWQEQTSMRIVDLIARLRKLGISNISVTNIAREGEQSGPDFKLYKDMRKKFPDVDLVATGGIRSVSDLEELQGLGCSAALVGKALFDGEIPLTYFRVHSKVLK